MSRHLDINRGYQEEREGSAGPRTGDGDATSLPNPPTAVPRKIGNHEQLLNPQKGQPLPRDLNGALLALNALLDQCRFSNNASHSARAAEEKSLRLSEGSLDRILAYQANLI